MGLIMAWIRRNVFMEPLDWQPAPQDTNYSDWYRKKDDKNTALSAVSLDSLSPTQVKWIKLSPIKYLTTFSPIWVFFVLWVFFAIDSLAKKKKNKMRSAFGKYDTNTNGYAGGVWRSEEWVVQFWKLNQECLLSVFCKKKKKRESSFGDKMFWWTMMASHPKAP